MVPHDRPNTSAAGKARLPTDMASLQFYLSGLERRGVKPGLARITRLLELCGNPQDSVPCIHVSGTNGKGSVCALLESVLRAAGYRTGLYTSPHLVSYRERIRICGNLVAERELVERACALIPKAESMGPNIESSPSYFEFTTALAFSCFARARVDYAVVEVGLGGRFDATNVVNASEVAVTSIDLEHQAQLGDCSFLIAGEKAAIIKEGAYVVCGGMDEDAFGVVQRRCSEKRAILMRTGSDIIWRVVRQSPEGSSLSVRGVCGSHEGLFLPFAGRHQAENCAVTLGLVAGLRERGAEITDRAVRQGIAAARWPGRMDILSRDPLLLVDCAHNPAGARAVAASVREVFPGRRWAVVSGMLRDKNIGEMCEAFLPLASVVVTTNVPSDRSAGAGEVAEAYRKCAAAELHEAAHVSDALSLALRCVAEKRADGIFLAGSIYLVGEAMKWAGVEPFP